MTRRPSVYLIGIQGKGHPGGARFPTFSKYMDAEFVGSPLKFRFMVSRWGSRVDRLIAFLSRYRISSLGLLVMELAAGTHMLFHRKSVYHSLKGEVDLNLLPFLSRLTGTYLVATFHDPPDELREKKKIGERVTRHLAGVILLCESQRPHFEELFPPERIFCVPHGIDTEFFRPARELCEEPVVVAVGSYGRDFETLGKAIPLVWEKDPRVRFILIGTRQADEWSSPPRFDDPRVLYLDGISDEELRSTYHASRVALVSVKDATANNAVLEAMACGLPVVATDVGGIVEYLGEEAGILCSPRNPRALASGVLQVLADGSAASNMRAAGRKRALRYEYQVVADELCWVYAEVAKMGKRVPVGP